MERGYVTYVSAGAAMCAGRDESKGDDGGGLEEDDDTWSVRLGDGSTVSFRSMHVVARNGAQRWRVRREVKVEYSFPAEWPGHTTNCEMVTLADDSEEYKEVCEALLRDVGGAKVLKIER